MRPVKLRRTRRGDVHSACSSGFRVSHRECGPSYGSTRVPGMGLGRGALGEEPSGRRGWGNEWPRPRGTMSSPARSNSSALGPPEQEGGGANGKATPGLKGRRAPLRGDAVDAMGRSRMQRLPPSFGGPLSTGALCFRSFRHALGRMSSSARCCEVSPRRIRIAWGGGPLLLQASPHTQGAPRRRRTMERNLTRGCNGSSL